MKGASEKYDRLMLHGAWRAFEITRGAGQRDLERRVRSLEQNAAALNLEPEAVHLAAELAALETGLDDDARFALIVLVLVTLAAQAQGSTRFPIVGQASIGPMREVLGALLGPELAEVERVRKAIESLVSGGAAPRVIGRSDADRLPLLFLYPFIAHQRSRKLELRLVDRIVALRKRDAPFDETAVDAALDDVIKRPAMTGDVLVKLSGEQRQAIKIASQSPLALISGGPGTGKTSIVVAIIRVLARLGVAPAQIALSAPTGRAAFRMRESMAASLARIDGPSSEDELLRAASLDASTVHRLLGYSPERGAFLHHRNNPIAARVVIVDEASMLDLALIERLVSALDRDAQLIVLGDADQLPSVAAGAAFRDLLPPDRDHPLFASSVRLTHNYRTRTGNPAGAAIVELCRRINEGDTGIASALTPAMPWRSKAEEVKFDGVELLNATEATLDTFLERWGQCHLAGDDDVNTLVEHEYALAGGAFTSEDRGRLARLFDHRTTARMLCVTRVGPSGSDSINKRMHAHALRNAPRAVRSQPMIAGEPVIVVRNDYERTLFNGDQGVIVNVRDSDGKGYPVAVFGRGSEFVAFRLDTLRDLIELGYATTVHKAQGSEFDVAAVILPDHDLPLLTRELLYTAASRCRRAVAIVGEPQVFAAGIARKAERYSGIAEELVDRVKPKAPKQMSLFGGGTSA